MASSDRVLMTALCCALAACGPSSLSQPDALTSLAKANNGELRVEMLSASPLVAGQNRVFYRVTNEGEALSSAQLAQRPEHTCPLHDPSLSPNADGLWEGLVIFPSAGAAGFGLDVKLKPDEASQRIDLGVLTVGDSPLARLLMHDGENVLIAIAFPEAPHVGRNELVVSAHMEHESMGYRPADEVVFTLNTQMPTMGHGVAGNVNPARGDDGAYRGSAVFSMSGDWILQLEVSMHGESLGTLELSYAL